MNNRRQNPLYRHKTINLKQLSVIRKNIIIDIYPCLCDVVEENNELAFMIMTVGLTMNEKRKTITNNNLL